MNLVQAIMEVNMDAGKVFEAGEHTVESCNKINCCNGSPIVDHSHNVFVKNLPALMQLDFHEVVDWGKVKKGTDIVCTDIFGKEHKATFLEYDSEEKRVHACTRGDVWSLDHVRLAE